VLESKDTDRINAAKEKLTKASHKLAQAAYGTPGEGGSRPAPARQGGAPGGDGGGNPKGPAGRRDRRRVRGEELGT
jgi:hypothetical protein